jgi:hypothetical protein
MAATGQRAQLLAHPDTPGEWVWSIGAEVELAPGAALVCHYELHGEVGRLRVPAARTGRRADGLWQHTCFEVFAAAQGGGYYEFNFAPSLEWAAYRFSGYRDGMTPASLARAPGLKARRTPDRLELTANLYLEGLAELARAGQPLRLGLSAVVEDEGGRLSYWALRHAPGNPDFHDPDAFALEISTS